MRLHLEPCDFLCVIRSWSRLYGWFLCNMIVVCNSLVAVTNSQLLDTTLGYNSWISTLGYTYHWWTLSSRAMLSLKSRALDHKKTQQYQWDRRMFIHWDHRKLNLNQNVASNEQRKPSSRSEFVKLHFSSTFAVMKNATRMLTFFVRLRRLLAKQNL